MKKSTRLANYISALADGKRNGSRLVCTWKLLSKPRKKYARYLVETYRYEPQLAIQMSYIHGFDQMPYDYRQKRPVIETRTAKSFGL